MNEKYEESFDSSAELVTEPASCEKYRPALEYTFFQELIDNLPYALMTLLGSTVIIIGLKSSWWGWGLAILYAMYSITGVFWIILFLCPYCHLFNTRSCPCGYGRLAARWRAPKDSRLFREKYKKHIPVIVPLWFIPPLTGGIMLIKSFSWLLFLLLIIFILDAFMILPLFARKYGCTHCPQKDACPWMEGKDTI